MKKRCEKEWWPMRKTKNQSINPPLPSLHFSFTFGKEMEGRRGGGRIVTKQLEEIISSAHNVSSGNDSVFLSFGNMLLEISLEAMGRRPDNSLLREYVNGFQLPRAMFPGLEAGKEDRVFSWNWFCFLPLGF
jgi:hypothetical protein